MVSYEVFEAQRLVRFNWCGPVTAEELAEISIDYAHSTDFDPRFRMSMDLTDGWMIGADPIRVLVELCGRYYKAHSEPTRSAILALDARSQRIAKEYIAAAGRQAGYPIRQFEHPGDAFGYLGLEEGDPEARIIYPYGWDRMQSRNEALRARARAVADKSSEDMKSMSFWSFARTETTKAHLMRTGALLEHPMLGLERLECPDHDPRGAGACSPRRSRSTE